MPKKPTIKALKDKLWKITSKIVRLQSDRCYTCGKYLPDLKSRSACHFWPKSSHNSVRYDLDNLRVGCNTCNLFKSGNLAEYSVQLMAEIGKDRFDALAARAHELHKFARPELEDLIFTYSQKLNDLLNQENS